MSNGEIAGRLIITWPRSGQSHLFGHRIVLTNADTNQQITDAIDLDLTVHADAKSLITAEMTMLATADGKPLPHDAKPVITRESGDAELATGRFTWIVAEMRIAE